MRYGLIVTPNVSFIVKHFDPKSVKTHVYFEIEYTFKIVSTLFSWDKTSVENKRGSC